MQESTGEAPEAEGYNLPAYSIFQNVSDNDVSLGIANATVDGAVCKFDNGASITMSGKASQVVFSAGNYYQLNAKFTGWGAEDAKDLIMRIPVREEISGDMRMFWQDYKYRFRLPLQQGSFLLCAGNCSCGRSTLSETCS